MIPQHDSPDNPRAPLRDRYEFECFACGAAQAAAPSLAMIEGVNSLTIHCTRCRILLHVEITPDLGGSSAVSERQSTFLARKQRIEREIIDGGY